MTSETLSLNAPTDVDVTLASAQSGNKPDRLCWFGDLALGLFIHWNLDVQLGMVISHSLVGASHDYVERYFTQLPRTFCPTRFDPDEWARLARVAGFRYVVFTTKHHCGFCMFDTATTDFSVMHTPFGQDVTRWVVEAFRKQGLAIGLYFSPDDFSVLRRQGIEIARGRSEVDPVNNAELMAINRAQIRELLSNYGAIDLVFLDGQPEGLKQLAWELQPDIVVTRGDIATPEQQVPDAPLPMPWESCVTMATAWQYQPTNEIYKSGRELITLLAETRAKGGNLLLNVGPKPNGELPTEQTERLMELGLWNFVNGEAIFGARPWHATREDGVWYTRAPEADTVYAILTDLTWGETEAAAAHSWTQGERIYGKRANITLHRVRATPETEIQILGQTGRTLEYRDTIDPRPRWRQDEDGLHLTVMSAQRIYDMWGWTNPIVVKITHAA